MVAFKNNKLTIGATIGKFVPVIADQPFVIRMTDSQCTVIFSTVELLHKFTINAMMRLCNNTFYAYQVRQILDENVAKTMFNSNYRILLDPELDEKNAVFAKEII